MFISTKLNREIIKNNDKFIELIKSLDPISVILYGSYSINKQTNKVDTSTKIATSMKTNNTRPIRNL